MYLAISLALVAMVILVFWLNWQLRKRENDLRYWIREADAFKSSREQWVNSALSAIYEAADLRKQAKAFEQTAKTMENKANYFETMLHKCEEERDWLKENQNVTVNCTSTEEHLAAERGRADRLAEALRMSEDARCELKQKLAKAQEESRKRSSMDTQLKRELLNLFRYDGTEQSQEDLTDE